MNSIEPINYIGEHLWAGRLGNFFIILSFVAALLSTVSYFFSARNPLELSWKKIGRIGFRLHSVGVVGIVCTLFFMLYNHYFEYQYVWQHSNMEMKMKYIFSCFWEGQEGSFLLWTFWHMIIGNILIKTSKNFEAPVMFMFSFVQFFLASMLLGIYVFGTKIGTNPFLLLREHPDLMNAPFIKSENYVEKLPAFARGLNVLLQNYWMTIHPPTLFLGFALTLVPFAYAFAGVWKKEYDTWQKAALPWTFIGIAILGIGILMGGAWAYEALSFGGFWAWDPVENASLVPWITLVAAGHVMIINKNKKGSLFLTYFLCVTSFILVLYSTFLTRSGILGESSVHAFQELGMEKQLLLFLLVFIFCATLALLKDKTLSLAYVCFSIVAGLLVFGFNILPSTLLLSWGTLTVVFIVTGFIKFFPKDKTEDSLSSREFWMFVGALLLFLSALIISVFTSLSIFNKLFDIKVAPRDVYYYNQWTLPFAILVMLLSGFAQFMKYGKTESKKFLKSMIVSVVLSLAIGGTAAFALYTFKAYEIAPDKQKSFYISYAILLMSCVFSVFANLDYWLRILKGKIKSAGASIAHIGFALIMLGALISTSKKVTLSKNTSTKNVESLGKEYSNKKSLLLTKGDTLKMGPYYASYTGKKKEDNHILFHVEYYEKNEANKLVKAFDLYPRIQLNERGNAAEPDTRHYLDKDIYTHITYADLNTLKTMDDDQPGYLEPVNNVMHIGDTIFASTAFLILDSLTTDMSKEEYEQNDSSIVVTAVLRGYDIDKKVYKVYPKYRLRFNEVEPVSDSLSQLGLKFIFWKINPTEGSVEIQLSEKKTNRRDFIVMEGYLFPYINILWLGCLVMFVGTVIAIISRVRMLRVSKSES
ncbi:MAG: cytochrome c biosis factor [Bacteroidetes bacterium]|nr:cytochrome c biosis factor [Bacteroidota bacterium]